VYGLTSDANKPVFLEELHELSQVRHGPWMLCGDFNMTVHKTKIMIGWIEGGWGSSGDFSMSQR
jgi:hypothetical protein